MRTLFIGVSCLIALSACGMNTYAKTALKRKNIEVTSTEKFMHCYGYGCVKKAEIQFSEKDWNDIKRIMHGARTPQQERNNIANAIGVFEIKVGKQAGTNTDKGGTFVNMMDKDNQQDCVDESLNSTIYVTLMEQKGLLKYHTAEDPTVRLPIIHSGRWPHQTAVISEIKTNEFYVVDSWFHDNGHPAEIVPLKEWKDGWKPDKYRRN